MKKKVKNSPKTDDENLFIAIKTIGKIEANTYLFVFNDVDDYMFSRPKKSRIFWTSLPRIALLLNTLRFGITGIINTQSVRIALMDFTYTMGNPILASLGISSLSAAVLAVALIISYQELTHTMFSHVIYYRLKHKFMKYPLDSMNYHKLSRGSYFFTRHIFWPGYLIGSITLSLLYLFLSLRFYSTLEEKLISAITLIIANVIFTLTAFQGYACVWLGIINWIGCTEYLKMKFLEINRKIELSLNKQNINAVMNAIREHNYVELLTKDQNHFFRALIFCNYYIATIGFQCCLFAVHSKDSTRMARFCSGFVFFTCFWSMVLMNYLSTRVGTAAHITYPVLYAIINKNNWLTFRQRWKLLSFIEKLSGPQIGFYCYDLFPMNNYEFYQYLYIAGSNYFLLLSFFE